MTEERTEEGKDASGCRTDGRVTDLVAYAFAVHQRFSAAQYTIRQSQLKLWLF